MSVLYETLYIYLYEQAGADKPLKAPFRHPRRERQKSGGEQERGGQIVDRIGIENRPAIVKGKVRVGDWEGEAIEDAGKSAYFATFVDKTNKMLL
jgi:IS30 family transposase